MAVAEKCYICGDVNTRSVELNRRRYTVEEILEDTVNMERHMERFLAMTPEEVDALLADPEGKSELCLDCLKKHCSNIGGLCREAEKFLPEEGEIWAQYRDLAREIRESTVKLKQMFAQGDRSQYQEARDMVHDLLVRLGEIRKQIDPVCDSLILEEEGSTERFRKLEEDNFADPLILRW